MEFKVCPDRLRYHRKRLGLTQKEMARRAGVTPSTWLRYETGDRSPGQTRLPDIEAACEVELIDLLPAQSSQLLRRLRNTLWDMTESDAPIGTKFNALLNYIRWAYPAGEVSDDKKRVGEVKDILQLVGMKALLEEEDADADNEDG